MRHEQKSLSEYGAARRKQLSQIERALVRTASTYNDEDGIFAMPMDLAAVLSVSLGTILSWCNTALKCYGGTRMTVRQNVRVLRLLSPQIVILQHDLYDRLVSMNPGISRELVDGLFIAAARRTAARAVDGKPTKVAQAARAALIRRKSAVKQDGEIPPTEYAFAVAPRLGCAGECK